MKKSNLIEFIAQSNEYQGVSHRLFIDALNEGGFWLYRGANNSIMYIRLVEGILHPADSVDMKEYILKEVKSYKGFEEKKEDVLELIHKNASKLFGPQHLETLPILEQNLLRDTKDASYICYKNGIVKVTADNITTDSYSNCGFHIWKSQILNREFHEDHSGTDNPCDFEKFLQNVCNNDVDRLNSLKSIIGYLLHGHKHPGRPFAVIFLDERIPSQENMPNGRTGKGLIVTSISKLRKAITEDGKRFNVKGTFSLQSVTLDTKLLVFDDVGLDFNFEELFGMITEGLYVENKHVRKYLIPYEDSPKIILTSNYILSGQGSSHEARRIEFELSSHYNEKHKPEDDFGHLFFDDWNPQQWNQFDNLMLKCLQLYLKKGIIKPKVINKDFRLLSQETSIKFAEFAREKVILGKEYKSTELLQEFIDFLRETEGEDIQLSSSRFTKYLKKYAEVYKLNFDSKRSNGKTIVQFQSS